MISKGKIINADGVKYIRKLKENSVDYIITSVPYYRNKDNVDDYVNIKDDYYSFLKEVITQSIRVARYNSFILIRNNGKNEIDNYSAINYFSPQMKELLIWNKQGISKKENYVYNTFELILVFGDAKLKTYFKGAKNVISLRTKYVSSKETKYYDFDRTLLYKYLLGYFTFKNSLVLDIFSGFGDLAISSAELNRNFICLEKNKHLYNISLIKYDNSIKQKKLFY